MPIDDFIGIPDFSNYLITKSGKVYSKNFNKTGRLKELKQYADRQGYKYVVLYDKNKKPKHVTVHRLVAMAFIPPVDRKTCVNHIDGNKQNNYYENLEWCTHSENTRHSYNVIKTQSYERLAKIGRYSANKLRKFSDADVIDMKNKHFVQGKSFRKLASEYKCGKTVVERIVNGVTYANIV